MSSLSSRKIHFVLTLVAAVVILNLVTLRKHSPSLANPAMQVLAKDNQSNLEPDEFLVTLPPDQLINDNWNDEDDLDSPYVWPNCTPYPCQNPACNMVNRKDIVIAFNLIKATQQVSCDQNYITLTTQGDYRFLDNLVPIAVRWRAPVSLALYVTYDDLEPTLQRLAYVLACMTPLIKQWVSVHLFTEKKYTKYTTWDMREMWTKWKGKEFCDSPPKFDDQGSTTRTRKHLPYPVNLARNIAREGARTVYVFPVDIELYPSPEFVPRFFQMLKAKQKFFEGRGPQVFVLPIFEVAKNESLPSTKPELLRMLDDNVAVPFHMRICPYCHLVPKYKEWLAAAPSEDNMAIDVFHIAKRHSPFENWEPIYVSKNDVPFYDESLTWDGLRDKMPQAYKLCVMDYDFMILNNAFLVHKPGIKKPYRLDSSRKALVGKNNHLISQIVVNVTQSYGTRRGCAA